MARSAALNPASVPFFPGGMRGSDEDGTSTFTHHLLRETDRMSSLSISPSEYRSVRSSPSPPQDSRSSQQHHSPIPPDAQGTSPTFRQVEASKPYPLVEMRHPREASVVGSLDTLPEVDVASETLGSPQNVQQNYTPSPATLSVQPTDKRLSTSPVPVIPGGTSFHTGGFSSSSPVSSLDSASQVSPDHVPSFEAQLRASPFIHEILDRLVRCEYSTREIQRSLSDMDRKVTLLVEHTLANAQQQQQQQPEFKDPFSVTNGQNFNQTNGPRPSIGNIAPNQSAPSDDITTITQRLNTLTSSVGQLLALQTQQMQVTEMRSGSIAGLPITSDIPPNQIAPSMPVNANLLGHGLPNRPDLRPSPRPPNPPMRTWSTGNIEIPMRPGDNSNGLMRQEQPIRDKRRSVSGLLRRESSGVLDLQGGENWSGSQRDSGPLVTKWEQLALAPDLLRSLSKFGVGPPNKIQQRALPFLLRGADIIAQAPPTQERIAAYVIPAIQIAVTTMSQRPNRGPIVIMISTTVDQATQAQRMIRDLGGPIGVRSALGVGTTTVNNDLAQELRLLQQNTPHIICGTPQKLHALFTSPGGLSGSEVRFLVLDEVDQLIARNLHDFVFNIVKLLPPPRSRPLAPAASSSTAGQTPAFTNPFEPANGQNQGRRFSTVVPVTNPAETNPANGQPIERQTALFSNTVPQDVLNLASAIQLREPVRVLVRRDGHVANPDGNQGSRGLRQFYLYLAFTAGGRSETGAAPGGGLGIIGSGRGASSAESAQAREWKLDALADIFDDVDVSQAIVHVGGLNSLDAVIYKLASRGFDAVPLHSDMNPATKAAASAKFRNNASLQGRPSATKVLVVYDVQLKPPEVVHVPLIINYDLPKAVEEYAHRVAPAIASNYSRAGVVINFVTATGGDVEMLRSIECFYKIKCPEVPMSLREIV
ncbi:hypothetical protein BDN72DRAFT_786182 [Pluteus cervinus]|uniref:Uncharacterized protein n=1 Tax=Pluteus cervinus TaxID=181527 RepID=A0ACD3BD15_9AGAR|nr:hypothetical protein BDN72DRAFT_786182 [Pluteus cervinus]